MNTVTQTGKTRLVYILAASHSGSTLLAMLLARHPDICTAGELKVTNLGAVDRYLCSCRAAILKCEFWAAIKRRMGARGIPFDITAAGTHLATIPSAYVRRLLRPLHRGPFLEWVRDAALGLSPTWRRHFPEIQLRNAALAQAICAETGKDVIVDSSKVGIRLKYLLRNPDLDVRVIRLVRDGRAVALTYTDPAAFADAEEPRLRGGGAGAQARHERLPLSSAAHEWRRSNEEAEALLRTIEPGRSIEISYEQLCSELEATLRRLFGFIGVNPNRLEASGSSPEHHVVGNGMRLDAVLEVQLDERWKSVLTPAALGTFEEVAGSLNRKLGYRR